MITPDKQASKKVIARIGHVLPNEPMRALLSLGWSFMKKAIPGDSTKNEIKKSKIDVRINRNL